MTASHVVTARINPGRYDDWLEMTRRAAKIVERHGANNMRVMRSALGAETYNTTVFVSEHTNLEALGAFLDETNADGELVAMLTEVNGPHSPIQLLGETLVQEVPLGRAQGEPGRVVGVTTSRAKPGRLQDGMEIAARAFDALEAVGARNIRMWTPLYAGTQTDVSITTIEFDSLRALGRTHDQFATTKDGKALIEAMQSEKWPVVSVSQEIYIEIQL
jgi:hypothetical protein